MAFPFVEVIIPHLNDHERLAACLRLLHEQSYPADRYRITVVDNGSRRPIDDVVARWPRARASFEAARGCGSARNRGVAETDGDILAFTDSDCRPDRDWLANGVRALLPGGGADIVAGDIKVFAADEDDPTDAELFDKVFGFEPKRYVRWKHFATGANILTRRAVFEAVGPFKDGNHPEDLEWGRRAWRMGFRIRFVPEAVVRHPARRSWAELTRKADRTVFHNLNHMRDRPLFLLRWTALAAALMSPPLVKAWIIATTPELSRPSFRLRALGMTLRLRWYRIGRMAACLRPAPAPAPPLRDTE